MGWSANWDSTEGVGKIPGNSLNELRSALIERSALMGRTLNAACFQIEPGDIVPSSWFGFFEEELNYIIQFYINHTNSGGDWNGADTDKLAPRWTLSDIRTAAGITSYISAAPKNIITSAAWMFQRKKILNLLRWFLIQQDFTVEWGHDKVFTGDGDWNAAVTAFNLLNWGDASYHPERIGHWGLWTEDDSTLIARQRGWFSYTSNFPFDVLVDDYSIMGCELFGAGTYENNDIPNTANAKWGRVNTDVSIAAGATLKRYIGNFGNASVTKPSSGNINGWNMVSSVSQAIFKGVFEFRNW